MDQHDSKRLFFTQACTCVALHHAPLPSHARQCGGHARIMNDRSGDPNGPFILHSLASCAIPSADDILLSVKTSRLISWEGADTQPVSRMRATGIRCHNEKGGIGAGVPMRPLAVYHASVAYLVGPLETPLLAPKRRIRSCAISAQVCVSR